MKYYKIYALITHSDDQVSESIQNNNQFQSQVFGNSIPLPEVSGPFYSDPFNNFHSRAYNLN